MKVPAGTRWRGRSTAAVEIADLDALPRQHGPVAVLEIGDLVGEGGERDGVRTEIHLALAVPDRERRPVPGADELVLVAGEEEGERKGAAQPRQGRRDRLHRALALAHLARDELRHDLGVGLGLEAHALGAELVLELAEILDDAVVDDGELLGRVRVGVHLVGPPVGRPAGVADADRARQRRLRELDLEVAELALGAPALEPAAVLERCDAGRIIAAVFEPLQRVDDLQRDGRLAQYSDDPTHAPQVLARCRFAPAWRKA